MFSLRSKFVLALLGASLAAVVLAGGIVRWMLLQGITGILFEEAAARFQTSATTYISKYGSLEKAVQSEPSGPRPGPDMQQPPPARDHHPVRFLLLEPSGRVVLGDRDHQPGTIVPPALLRQARSVRVKGAIAAWIVPLAAPDTRKLDGAYLSAISQAVVWGIAGAGLLTLALGSFLGARLGGDLERLTAAIRAVEKDGPARRVEVRSRDEVGELAATFNRMTGDLARAREELQRTQQHIQTQAEELKELTVRDPLTRLYNRRHFDEQAKTMFSQAQRYKQPLTFVIADIDCFKQVNDHFSHTTGDEVLRRVASIIQTSVRQSDVLARYGGEEFALAFCNTPGKQAAAVCEKLRLLIENYPWKELDPNLRVTMSFGLCDDVQFGAFETMLRVADTGLYLAKEQGRNRVVFMDAPEELACA